MNFDTLAEFDELKAKGIDEESDRAIVALAAKAAQPEMDFKLEFERINSKFSHLDIQFIYMRMISIGILAAIIVSLVKHW